MSENNRICYVTNIAAHYRSAIYRLMDETFDIDFVFGDHPSDIKFDVSLLHNPTRVFQNTQLTKRIYYQKGIPFLFFKYDTILITGETHCLSTWLLLAFAYPFKKKRVFLWSHGWYGKEKPIEKVLKKLFFGMANGTFVYGDRAKELMVENGLNGSKIFPIHNSLDYDTQLSVRERITKNSVYKDHFNNSNPNLVYIGRLTPVKKLDTVIYALKKCKDNGTLFNMTFIGDGPVRQHLENLVIQLNLDKQVWFYGACFDEQINGLLIFNADLCVSPGNIGLTAIHCLTFGTPVITHNDFSHQMPEVETIVEGISGTYFNNDDIDSLASSILKWFKEKKNRERIRQDCYKIIEDGWTPLYQIQVLKDHLLC